MIGPGRGLRQTTRLLFCAALLAAALAVLVAQAGGGVSSLLWTSAFALAASIGTGWLGGGAEILVCEGATLVHRRAGALRLVRRALPVVELSAVRTANSPVPGRGGLQIESTRGVWTVARRLQQDEVLALADLLRRHLETDRRPDGARLPAVAVAPPPAPEPVAPGQALRRRHLFR